MKTVAEIMTVPRVTLLPTMSLAEARDVLVREGVSGAPVVNASGDLLGVFSQQDLLRVLFAEDITDSLDDEVLDWFSGKGKRNDWTAIAKRLADKQVADTIGPNVFTAAATDPVSHAAETMRKHKIHRLIVTDKGKVVGIVSTFDLLQLI